MVYFSSFSNGEEGQKGGGREMGEGVKERSGGGATKGRKEKRGG